MASTEEVRRYLCDTHRADLLCTVSSISTSFLRYGSHTEELYSMSGRIKDLYAVSLVVLETILRLRRRKPRALLAFLTIWVKWGWDHLRSSLIVTPKYLTCHYVLSSGFDHVRCNFWLIGVSSWSSALLSTCQGENTSTTSLPIWLVGRGHSQENFGRPGIW